MRETAKPQKQAHLLPPMLLPMGKGNATQVARGYADTTSGNESDELYVKPRHRPYLNPSTQTVLIEPSWN